LFAALNRNREAQFMKRTFSNLLTIAISLAALFPQISFAQTSSDKTSRKSRKGVSSDAKMRFSGFEARLEDLRNLLLIPGMSAAVVKDQKIIWSKGFGFADYENRVPATEHTPYRIASLTKTFASTLVMQLVEQGKISLDDSMSKYSADFKDDSVKVRHILSHTSEGTPGAKYKYNGDRYAYLDAVIEKTTGKTFRELLTENVLTKLKMSESVPGQDVLEQPNKVKDSLDARALRRYEDVLARLAKPYNLYGDKQIILTPYPIKRITTAADFVSTVVDLAKYDAAIDRHSLLKKETQESAWTPAISNDGQILPYGLGWFAQNYRGVRLVWHNGQWSNFSALLLKVPEKNLTFILLANSGALSTPFGLGSSGDVTRSPFALTFLRMFVFENAGNRALPDFDWKLGADKLSAEIANFEKDSGGYKYDKELQSLKTIEDWRARRRRNERREIKVDSKILDDYVGTYELRPQPLVITKEGDRLMGEGPGQPKAELFAASETEFFLKAADASVTFVRDAQGKVTHLMLYLSGQTIHAEKLK
jgi:CubicO group peptidase (beta-lactamase class C family)